MARAVTAFRAFGMEIDEPTTKHFRQVAILTTTAANTDTAFDIGNNTGSFWTDANVAGPGATALAALKDIQTRAKTFLGVRSPDLESRSKIAEQILTFTSAASAGGGATETYVVTGLLSAAHGDTILAVSPAVVPANAVYMKSFQTQADNALGVTYSGDPGAGAKVQVTVLRKAAATVAPTPDASQYVEAVQNLRPNLTFNSGDAPTAAVLWLEWDLQDGQHPVNVSA